MGCNWPLQNEIRGKSSQNAHSLILTMPMNGMEGDRESIRVILLASWKCSVRVADRSNYWWRYVHGNNTILRRCKVKKWTSPRYHYHFETLYLSKFGINRISINQDVDILKRSGSGTQTIWPSTKD